jgi:hypothetical protein
MLFRPQYRFITPAALYGGGSILQEDYTAASTLTWLTHTSTGHATMFDSTGKLTFAPNNMFIYSQDFSQSDWASNGTKVSTTATDPLGGSTALTWLATSGYQWLSPFASANPAAGNYVLSFWAKRASGSNVLSVFDGSGVELATYSPTSSWVRYTFAITMSGAGALFICQDRNGSGFTNVDIAFAQLERVTYQTSASTYVSTNGSAYYGPRFDYNPVGPAARGLLIEESRTNLIPTGDVSTAWSINGSGTKTEDFAVCPTGLTRATKFTPPNSASAYQGIYPASQSTSNGVAHTISVFAKKNDFRWVLVDWYDGSTNYDVWFDLTNGVVGTQASGSTGQIQDCGGGWYRLSHTRTASAQTAAGFYLADADNTTTSTGDASKYNLWYGAQLEAGSFPTSHIPTTTGSVQRAAGSVAAALYTADSVTEYYRNVSDLTQSSTTRNPFSGISAEANVWIEKVTKP